MNPIDQDIRYTRNKKSDRWSKTIPSGFGVLVVLLTLVSIMLGGCSTKKNTAMSRNWQAFTTRYNVYYNGHEHFVEQLREMEKNYADDYSRMLLTHPAEARADQKLPQPTGDFTRSIEKMQKAIQLHSIKKKPARKNSSAKEKAFRARDEFNPFMHNAWLTLGKSQYYNGDFLGAASTFFYISKHFTWLPKVVTEARIWQSLSYSALDWNYEAENALHPVKEKDLVNKELRNLYNLAKADLLIRAKRYTEAIPFLQSAAKNAKGSQRNRLWFLLGQLYSLEGKRSLAYGAFKKAGSGVSTPYRVKFNARIKQSEVFDGKNIKPEVNALRAMTRYARNDEFLDQIYYAIGNLYLSRGDSAEAIKNYALAAEKSKRNGIDKALAQLALGNIYYAQGDYVKAQPCYAEAVPQLPESYPDYKTLKRRSDVLDQLAVYAGNVELQDSLLTLAEMTPEQQREVCQKIVDRLIKQEKEEAEAAKREEYLADQAAQGNNINNSNTAPGATPSINSDRSWYFYNTMTKNQGKIEFQRRWGARKLEDDWRRRNKASFAFEEESDSDSENTEDGEADTAGEGNKEGEGEDSTLATDPHNVEYYLAQIPKTEAEKTVANDIIQEGMYNIGVILKDQLDDFTAATKEFNELNKRYPDNIYRLDVYYNLYLIAARQGDTAAAEHWRQMIINEFPNSPYGLAMIDPMYFENLRRMNQLEAEMYETAYNAYLDDNNAEVHRLTSEMERDYPLSKLIPKFVFIDALSYVTENENDRFRDRLSYLLEKWPETDMTEMAGEILKGLKAGRVPNAGLSNSRGMVWSMRLSNDEGGQIGADGQPANFERDPESPQYLVLVFPRDSVSANALLYDVARFNFSTFVVKDFDLEQMNFGNVGLLIIKGFDNLRQVEHYRTVLGNSEFRLPEAVMPVIISKPNFELLLREGRSFEEYFRFEEEKLYEDGQKPALTEPDESAKSDISDDADMTDETDESENADETDETENSEAAEEPSQSEESANTEHASESPSEPAESATDPE